VLAGLIAGYGVMWVPALSALSATWFVHWEIGLVALIVNAVVTVGLSLTIPRRGRVVQPA
jgi:SSS family solute:Na+ symporter